MISKKFVDLVFKSKSRYFKETHFQIKRRRLIVSVLINFMIIFYRDIKYEHKTNIFDLQDFACFIFNSNHLCDLSILVGTEDFLF